MCVCVCVCVEMYYVMMMMMMIMVGVVGATAIRTVFCIVNWLFGLYYLLGLPSLVSRSNAPITNMTSTEGTYYVRPSWNARGPVCHAATLPRRSIDRSIDIDDESTEDGGQREKIDQWSTGR